MAFEDFDKLQEKYKTEAQTWVENNFEADIQSKFSDFEWEYLYSDYVKKDDSYKSLHDWVTDAISKVLAEEIDKALNDKKVPFNEMVELYTDASEKAFYRHCAVMGIKAEDANPGWMSKNIYLSKLKSQSDLGDLLKYPEINKHLGHISKMLGNYHDILRDYSTLKSDHILKRLNPIVKDFVINGSKVELANYILDCTLRCDGRYNVDERNYLDNTVTAKTLNLLLGRSDFSANDISTLRKNKSISPVKLWDTKFFNDYYAPLVTPEGITQAKEYYESFSRSESLLMKLKDTMSDEDIMSHIVSNGRGDIQSWEFGINRFAAITNKTVTFLQAQEMAKNGERSIHRTKAYLNYIDANFDADIYSKIVTDIYFTSDDPDFQITVDCKSLCIDSISEEISNETLKYPELNSSSYAGDSIIFGGGVFMSLTKERLEEIAGGLKQRLTELNNQCPLPGDVVQVIYHEDHEVEDMPTKEGYKGQVVEFDGHYAKLKGIDETIHMDCLEIKKKYTPEVDISISAAL